MTVLLETARTALLAAAVPAKAEPVPLETCWRRVMAEAVVADMDFPPFDRSPLDGYALVAAEVEAASFEQPVWLKVVEDLPAGRVPVQAIGRGLAARIMTGAPVPAGATGVVRLEDVAAEGGQVAIYHGAGCGENICVRGEEIAAGERVILPGTVINAGVMGLLALLGKDRPLVYQRPRAAIFATGGEVRPVAEPLPPGTIRNSNSYMLAGQVLEAGGEPVHYSIAPDSTAEIAARLAAAAECDLVVTTGGVSVGDYDLMADAYRAAGITILFERVSIKPGMPVLAGVKDGRLYLGLSGNPAAAAIAFEQLVRPVIVKMSGRSNWARPRARARLTSPFAKQTGAPRFLWARCTPGEEGLYVQPLSFQGNGMLKSAAAANALIAIPAHSPPLPAGAEVEVLLLTGV